MEKQNLRKAYGDTLVELGAENKNIVALEADLGKSTMSILFGDKYPDRYFQMGIAEADMASVSAGLAFAGKIPFYSTFAVFASGRPYDQIRCSIAIPEANVKICGSSCGLSDFGDGKTHQSVEDANIIKTLPHIVVLNPLDAVEVKKMLRWEAAYKGPVYLRVGRNDMPVYTSPDTPWELGKIYPIAPYDNGKDVAIFATGVMVSQAMEAAEQLAKDGVGAQVLNVSTLKPLKADEALRYAKGKKAVVCAEEAEKTGGMGEEIASMLLEAGAALPFGNVAINDRFCQSAHGYDELLAEYGLTAGDLVKTVKKLIK
jgi:transketolase